MDKQNLSPEWFKEESSYYIEQDKEANVLYKEFQSKFGPEKLKLLTDENLLSSIFLGKNTTNLCYALEFDEKYKKFGGIGGGTAYKFDMFYSTKDNSWKTCLGKGGQRSVSTEEALFQGKQILQALLDTAEIIKNHLQLKSIEDYNNLLILFNENIKINNFITKAWVMKYFHMIYPEVFASFFADYWLNYLIQKLGLQYHKEKFLRMGELSLFIQKCNTSTFAFSQVIFNKVGAPPEKDNETNYWWLNANPSIWSLSNLKVGDTQSYNLYNESGHKRRIFKNFKLAKVNDMVIGYEATPIKQIVAICKVSSAQDGKKIIFKKTEELEKPVELSELQNCAELSNMEFFKNPNGSFFKLTNKEYEFILNKIKEKKQNEAIAQNQLPSSYSQEDFLNDVFMSEESYKKLKTVLEKKKNIILQGAPGVGKTFAAKRLAWSIIGNKDNNQVEVIQFHQNYSYEDFMMGYKPVQDGFELKTGVFYNFCKKAEQDKDNKYFFIIDEINRGNMSKIFGELLMLIENDYRGQPIKLAYNGEDFSVPENLSIIGLMNTADRSLAMIDYALRRRFSFFNIEPGFESQGFKKYQNNLDNEVFNELIKQIKALNNEISEDKTLGKGFCIGHSYFCGLQRDNCSVDTLNSIVDYDVLPMLREYWFDDDNRYNNWALKFHELFE